jgi:chromatin remodeling complex protein RSC6
MAKAKKTETTKGSASTVPVVNVEVAAETVTTKTTTAKTPRTKSTKTTPSTTTTTATAPVTKDPVETTPVAGDVSGAATDSDVDLAFTESFTNFLTKLQTIAQQMNTLKAEFRTLEKKAVRELKAAQKVNAKRKRKSGNRSPSGFVKPTLISDELATFLNKPSGTEMARTEVTREINSYIRAHDLQDKDNGRKINPDQSLSTLLKIGQGDELTYFNLQRYMSPHFAKASSTVKP